MIHHTIRKSENMFRVHSNIDNSAKIRKTKIGYFHLGDSLGGPQRIVCENYIKIGGGEIFCTKGSAPL